MHGFELGVCEGGMGDDRHIVTLDEGDEVADRGGNAAVVWRDEDSSAWPEVAPADPTGADTGAQGVRRRCRVGQASRRRRRDGGSVGWLID
jgi:hypothetical protein